MATSSDLCPVEREFHNNGIVPDTLDVAPKKPVIVSYPSGFVVDFGRELTPTQVKDKPRVSWTAEKGVYYTLMMIDPDAPTRENRELGDVRHWLVMNILENSVETGDEIVEYQGSGPPQGSGMHRYTFLVYKQNGMIQHNEPRSAKLCSSHRLKKSASEFAQRYNLGNPEFGNFYYAQHDPYVDILKAQCTE